jgi:hypothetical protein
MRTQFTLFALIALAAILPGCFGPDYNAIANRLREKNMQQAAQLDTLKQQLANRDATIRDDQARLTGNLPPIQTLPPDRLAQVFTAARMSILGQTDTDDFGDGKGLSGFRVFIRFHTSDGQVVPAAGDLTIDAFELPMSAQPRRLGTWNFTPAQMKANWYTALGSNYFAFNCPWNAPPTIQGVTFKARLRDALTGQTLEAELNKKITLPPPAPPAPTHP